jgi:hypothetical protein
LKWLNKNSPNQYYTVNKKKTVRITMKNLCNNALTVTQTIIFEKNIDYQWPCFVFKTVIYPTKQKCSWLQNHDPHWNDKCWYLTIWNLRMYLAVDEFIFNYYDHTSRGNFNCWNQKYLIVDYRISEYKWVPLQLQCAMW